MGRTIQLDLSDEVLSDALVEAKRRAISLDDLVAESLKRISGQNGSGVPNSKDTATLVELALERARARKKGDQFTVPDLFSRDEWQRVTPGNRKTVGKLFRREVAAGKHPIAIFLKRNQVNQAVYLKA
jgi:hypothetical protein